MLSGDAVTAAAILDRLFHDLTIITIKGQSYQLEDKKRAGLRRGPSRTKKAKGVSFTSPQRGSLQSGLGTTRQARVAPPVVSFAARSVWRHNFRSLTAAWRAIDPRTEHCNEKRPGQGLEA